MSNKTRYSLITIFIQDNEIDVQVNNRHSNWASEDLASQIERTILKAYKQYNQEMKFKSIPIDNKDKTETGGTSLFPTKLLPGGKSNNPIDMDVEN